MSATCWRPCWVTWQKPVSTQDRLVFRSFDVWAIHKLVTSIMFMSIATFKNRFRCISVQHDYWSHTSVWLQARITHPNLCSSYQAWPFEFRSLCCRCAYYICLVSPRWIWPGVGNSYKGNTTSTHRPCPSSHQVMCLTLDLKGQQICWMRGSEFVLPRCNGVSQQYMIWVCKFTTTSWLAMIPNWLIHRSRHPFCISPDVSVTMSFSSFSSTLVIRPTSCRGLGEAVLSPRWTSWHVIAVRAILAISLLTRHNCLMEATPELARSAGCRSGRMVMRSQSVGPMLDIIRDVAEAWKMRSLHLRILRAG